MGIRNSRVHNLILLGRILFLLRLKLIVVTLDFEPMESWWIIFKLWLTLTLISNNIWVLILICSAILILYLSWRQLRPWIEKSQGNWNLSLFSQFSFLSCIFFKVTLSLAVILLSNDLKVAYILLTFVRIKTPFHEMACCGSMDLKVAKTLFDIDIFEFLWYHIEIDVGLPLIIWLLLLDIKLLPQEYDLILIFSQKRISLVLIDPGPILNFLGSRGIPQRAHSLLVVQGTWSDSSKH